MRPGTLQLFQSSRGFLLIRWPSPNYIPRHAEPIVLASEVRTVRGGLHSSQGPEKRDTIDRLDRVCQYAQGRGAGADPPTRFPTLEVRPSLYRGRSGV